MKFVPNAKTILLLQNLAKKTIKCFIVVLIIQIVIIQQILERENLNKLKRNKDCQQVAASDS